MELKERRKSLWHNRLAISLSLPLPTDSIEEADSGQNANDSRSQAIIKVIESLPESDRYSAEDIAAIRDNDFKSGMFVIQLLLNLSKDELVGTMRGKLGERRSG